MNIYPASISKHSLNRIKQIIHLIIPNGEGWHYFAVENLSALLRGITSLCKLFNYFYSPRTKSRLEYHKIGIWK